MLKATEHTDDETMRWCWRKAKALTLTTAFMGNSICRYFLPNLTRPRLTCRIASKASP
jgi:hypothetical protein